MSNEKSKGIDGKQHRVAVVKSGKKPETAPKETFIQADPGRMAQVFCCARGDELKKGGFSVTYANCAGNVFSPEDPICRDCGACERIGNMYGRVGCSYLETLSLDGAASVFMAI